MDDLHDQSAHYAGFLSTFDFLTHAQNIQMAAEDLREDPQAAEAFLYYQEADHQRQQGSDEASSSAKIWNITGKGDLNDMLSVLRWRLINLESEGDFDKISNKWGSMNQEQVKYHLQRFESDRRKVTEDIQQAGSEWERLNGMSDESVKAAAAEKFRQRHKNPVAQRIAWAEDYAWQQHEDSLGPFVARRDAVGTAVTRLHELKLRLERIARSKGIDTELIQDVARFAEEEEQKTKGTFKEPLTTKHVSQIEDEGWEPDISDEDLEGQSDSSLGTQTDQAPFLTPKSYRSTEDLASDLEKATVRGDTEANKTKDGSSINDAKLGGSRTSHANAE